MISMTSMISRSGTLSPRVAVVPIFSLSWSCGYSSTPSQLLRRPIQKNVPTTSPAHSATAVSADNSLPTEPCSTKSQQVSHQPSTNMQHELTPSPLSWTEYFRLRRTLRTSERAGALFGGAMMFLGSSYYIAAVMDFDPDPIWGMDPTIIYGAGIVGLSMCAAAGGLVASASWWRVAKGGSILRTIDIMDRQFFEHVKAVRPADLRLSLQNPLPDYYAENVTSLAEYRTWLRKQREYRIKTEGFEFRKTTFLGRMSMQK